MAESRSLLEALNLARDPFAEPAEAFFAAGDRTRQLDELRQLSRGLRRLLVVTGERGVGKSVLFRAFSSRLDPGAKAARINANLVNDVMGVLTAVLQGLGVGLPERNKPDVLAEAIVEHARLQSAASRYCVVMVDDAHVLELRALETLLKMLLATPQRGLRMVFFAESRFVKSLEKAVERVAPGLTWHEVRLTPFSRDEVRRYLRFRFAEAGWEDHLPFTELQIQELIVDSGGLPGTLDKLASDLLEGPADGPDVAMLPPLHRAALLLLLVVVGMVWLVWSYDDDGVDGAQDLVVDEDVLTVAPPDTASTGSRLADPGAVGALEAPATAARGVVDRDGSEATPYADDVDASWDEADDVALEESEDEPPMAEEPPDVDRVDELPPAEEREVAPQPPSEPEPKHDPTRRSTPSAPLAPEPREIALATEPAPTRPEPAAAPAARESTPVTLHAGAKGVAWVMRQAPDRYTLQLFGTADRERMVAYVNRQPDIAEFALVTLERDGQPWYVVTYGVFTSPGAARTAARNLPNAIGRVDPWVRTFESVQDEIRQDG